MKNFFLRKNDKQKFYKNNIDELVKNLLDYKKRKISLNVNRFSKEDILDRAKNLKNLRRSIAFIITVIKKKKNEQIKALK